MIGLQAGLLFPCGGNTYRVSCEGAVCLHSSKYRQMGLGPLIEVEIGGTARVGRTRSIWHSQQTAKCNPSI